MKLKKTEATIIRRKCREAATAESGHTRFWYDVVSGKGKSRETMPWDVLMGEIELDKKSGQAAFVIAVSCRHLGDERGQLMAEVQVVIDEDGLAVIAVGDEATWERQQGE